MINTIRHIAPEMVKSRKTVFFLLVLLIFSACKNTEKVVEEEPSIFNQRKAFKSIFHQANSEKMIGHYEKAIALFEECLIMEPENPAVHFALSDLYEKQGDKSKTLSFAQSAYGFQTDNKWYALRLADLYFERREFAKTADLYAKIIEEEKNIDLKFRYTDALIKSKRFDEAIKMMEEIEVETGKIPEVTFTKYDLFMELGEKEKADQELQDFMAANPMESDYKIMVAEFYLQQNRFADSEKIVNSILANNPDYGQAYIMKADLELRQDNLAGAFSNLEKGFRSDEVEFERKLEILKGLIPYADKSQRDFEEMRIGIGQLFETVYDPALKNSKLHGYYGFFHVTGENLEAAEKQYQMACDIDPSDFNNWLQLLDIQSRLDHYEGMFKNGKEAAELFPAQPIIYLLTGMGAKGVANYEAAEEWLFLGKDLVVQDPQLTSEFLYQLGDMSFEKGDEDEGKFYFDEALQTYPGNVNVYADNAERLQLANDLTKALAEIDKGLAVVPKSAKLLDLKGQILFEQKKYNEAKDAFFQALYDNYYDVELLERCGDAFFLAGEPEKGIELWGESLKNGNKSPLLKRKFDERTYYEGE